MSRETYMDIFVGILIMIAIFSVIGIIIGAWNDRKIDKCIENTQDYFRCYDEIYGLSPYEQMIKRENNQNDNQSQAIDN